MGRIAIIHPNLGIGGAERLILDISDSLNRKGHKVTIFTNYYSTTHCFKSTKNMDIVNAFEFIPDSIFGAFKVYLASLKILLLSIYFIFFYSNECDLVIVDQIAVLAIPLLRLCKINVIFYCHFPDQFLTDRKTILKRIYRLPIDFLEIYCASFASKIVVNSKFTMRVLLDYFPSIREVYRKNPYFIDILYPCVSESLYETGKMNASTDFDEFEYLFVSINRFDPKKTIERAIEAMHLLKYETTSDLYQKSHLVIMGGCDPYSSSDQNYYKELVLESANYGLIDNCNPTKNHVTFIKNPSDEIKLGILFKAYGLVYTPDNEHFGIVPLESMMLAVPVLAAASGGPLETVINNVTGFHIKSFPDDLVEEMRFLIENKKTRNEMGESARRHCIDKFSFESFDESLNNIISQYVS